METPRMIREKIGDGQEGAVQSEGKWGESSSVMESAEWRM